MHIKKLTLISFILINAALLFSNTSFVSEQNPIIKAIEDTFFKAKDYVAKQYYTQSVTYILNLQEYDYEEYVEKYNTTTVWKKIWLFIGKIQAERLNKQIIEAGDHCLSLLQDDKFDKDQFKIVYNHFLELRNYFIAHYNYNNGKSKPIL